MARSSSSISAPFWGPKLWGLADLSAVLTREDETGTALVLDEDLLDILGDAGISPEAPISDNAPLSNTLGNAGVSIEEVMGATVSGDIVTVYLDIPIA